MAFDRNNGLALLAEAVQVSRDAVAATPPGTWNRAAYLGTLAGAFYG